MRSWQLLFWITTIVAGMTGPDAAWAQAARPEDALSERYGLHRLPGSNLWVAPVEADLRRLWFELPQHRDAVIALEQALAERIDRNGRDWLAADRTESSLRATLANLARADRQRPQFERQLSLLRRGIVAPERLASVDEVREQLVQLSDYRHALWLGAQAIRHKTALLDDTYANLRNDSELIKLLRSAGPKSRLGPAKDYRNDLKKLAELERPALTEWTPLFLAGEHQRLTLLANNSTPLTFSWTSSPEPTVITAAMAEAVGLRPRAGGKSQLVTVGKQSWHAVPAIIPYLRVGKFELSEVEVAILPPDAESAGARISPAVFQGYRVVPQPERLRFVIVPVSDATP